MGLNKSGMTTIEEYHWALNACMSTQQSGVPGEQNMVLFSGNQGTGKTQIVKAWAKTINYYVHVVLLSGEDPMDNVGMWVPDFKENKLKHLNTDRYLGEQIPKGYDGMVVFFDEIDKAQVDTQASILSTVEDRMHNNKPIPDNVIFVAAMNPPDSGQGGSKLIHPLLARCYEIVVTPVKDEWISWAIDNELDDRVIGFINFKEGALDSFDPKSKEAGQPNPRSWHKLSALMKLDPANCMLNRNAAAKVGRDMGSEFVGFCDMSETLASIEEIKDMPNEAIVPGYNVSGQYAVVSNIAAYVRRLARDKEPLSTDDATAFITYIRRLPEPIAVFGMRLIEKGNKEFTECAAYGEFITDYQQYDI
jgi:hypothetical protein